MSTQETKPPNPFDPVEEGHKSPLPDFKKMIDEVLETCRRLKEEK